MNTITAKISTATFALRERLRSDRGDGPADNSTLMALGVGAAAALGAGVMAAVAAKVGAFGG